MESEVDGELEQFLRNLVGGYGMGELLKTLSLQAVIIRLLVLRLGGAVSLDEKEVLVLEMMGVRGSGITHTVHSEGNHTLDLAELPLTQEQQAFYGNMYQRAELSEDYAIPTAFEEAFNGPEDAGGEDSDLNDSWYSGA